MNKALRIYTDYKENDLEEIGKSVVIVRDTLEILDGIFKTFNEKLFLKGRRPNSWIASIMPWNLCSFPKSWKIGLWRSLNA